jgi:hypothetical protein
MLLNLSRQELLEFAVQENQLPRYLYKYRPNSSFTDEIFAEKNIWFSNPNDFNDPFDCQITIDSNNSEDQIRRWIAKNASTLNGQEIKRRAKDLIKNPNKWHNILNDCARQIINQTGVCCFAKKKNNLLMWSHYANSHTGVCLGFDILKDSNLFETVIPARYDKSYPSFNYLSNPNDFTKMLIQTKSNDWEYEEEYRSLKIDFKGNFRYKEIALVEVSFGCKCTLKEVFRIKELISSNFAHQIIFKKAVISKTQFSLDFINI